MNFLSAHGPVLHVGTVLDVGAIFRPVTHYCPLKVVQQNAGAEAEGNQ